MTHQFTSLRIIVSKRVKYGKQCRLNTDAAHSKHGQSIFCFNMLTWLTTPPHKVGKRPPIFPREGQGGEAEYILVIKTCINMNIVGIMHRIWCKSKHDLRVRLASKILQHTKIYYTEDNRKKRVMPTSVTWVIFSLIHCLTSSKVALIFIRPSLPLLFISWSGLAISF